jgi:hypothetical protein
VTRNLQFLSGRNLVPLVTGNLNTHFPSFHPGYPPASEITFLHLIFFSDDAANAERLPPPQ